MSTQHAILVGLTEVDPRAYAGWDGKAGCAGCEKDVENMARILDPLGYEIQTLLTTRATQANILDSLDATAQQLTAGDTLLFFYAGHGGQQLDENGDEDDNNDETLMVYDGHLVDDDLHKIWLKCQPDVRIVMLSDSCNSGTNSRAPSVTPTPTPIQPVDTHTADGMAAEMFHMGGCRDGRTSIGHPDGGAFTLALVNAWDNGQFTGTYEELYQLVASGVDSDQKPQMNWYGPVTDAFRNGSVFRRNDHAPLSKPIQEVSETFIAKPRTDGGIDGGTSEENQRMLIENQRLLIEAHLKLIDMFGVSAPQRAAESPRTRTAADRHLVCVHGISTHVRGYSNYWWNALKNHTDAFGPGNLGSTRHEVLWSNLVNSRSMDNSDMPDEQAVAEITLRIQDVLEDRQRQQAAAVTPSINTRNLPQERGGGFALDDFVVYMTNRTKRQQIIDRFTDVIRPLLKEGATIDIISHSWGTVVAYEGLRELESDLSLTGKVANFFTVGSALSVPPVRGSLRTANKDGRKPNMVQRWVNLDAEGDLVGGSLRDKFEVDKEALDLVPSGCEKNLGGLGWFNLGCAHGSYFRKENRVVNAEIFGHYISR